MTNLGSIDVPAIKHICLVGNRDAGVQAADDTLAMRTDRTEE
jgi:hypothetical protein